MHFVDFQQFLHEDKLTFMTPVCLPAHQSPSEKGSTLKERGPNTLLTLSNCFVCLPSENGSTLKGKNLLPMGANSFLLE